MSASGTRPRLRLAVLASGRGSNLQALLDAARDPGYPAEVALALSDKADAFALQRARGAGAEAEWIDPAPPGLFDRIGGRIARAGAGLVCCAGFMRI
ncbi:MAG: formyltransferase family protein, partial [Nitrospinota bacterium]